MLLSDEHTYITQHIPNVPKLRYGTVCGKWRKNDLDLDQTMPNVDLAAMNDDRSLVTGQSTIRCYCKSSCYFFDLKAAKRLFANYERFWNFLIQVFKK